MTKTFIGNGLLVGLLGLQPLSSALAQSPGTVDTNFPAGSGPDNSVDSVVLQSDGRILAGGSFQNFSGFPRHGIVRLSADGIVDTNFLNNLDGAGTNGFVSTVAVQSNGKVLVGGFIVTADGVGCHNLARLNSDGTFDSNFGNPLSGNFNDEVNGVIVQPADQKVLVAGSFQTVAGTNCYGLFRLNTNGLPDTSFQNWLTPSFWEPHPFGSILGIVAATIQPDAKLLIAGEFRTVNTSPRTNIARLNIDGTVDTSFNPQVALTYYPYVLGGTATVGIQTMVLQPDGRIVIGGQFYAVNGVSRTNLARLNADGSLDTTFQNGMGGFSGPVSQYADPYVDRVLVQNSGFVLVSGSFSTVNGGSWPGGFARLNSDGSLDTSFTVVGPYVYGVDAMVEQTNGYVIGGGSFNTFSGVARTNLMRVYSGLASYDLCSAIPLPAGRTTAEIDPLNPPTVVPANHTFWDTVAKTLYPTNVGSITVTWHFTDAPTQAVWQGNITFPVVTADVGQELLPPACADITQPPDVGTGAYWHNFTHKLYCTAPGANTVVWRRPNASLLPQSVVGQWPTNPALFQIQVAGSAPVDVTGGGSFGSPLLLSQDPGTGATLAGNLFTTTSAGKSLHLVSAAGALAPSTNIYFQLVQSVLWNDPAYLRDTNTAVIGTEIVDPAHNPACGSPSVLNYSSTPARVCADQYFYDPTNRLGPVIPVNRSPSGTRTNDLVLALYQFGSKLKDPLTGNLLTNTVAWPYLPSRYLSVWPASPATIFIAGGQGSGPVSVGDPNWSVYRQPNVNQYGYNPNEEHAFRLAAAPPGPQLQVSATSLMVPEGGSVAATISIVAAASYTLQNPVTVTFSSALNGDSNLFLIFPTNATAQQLVFTTTNWQTPQTIFFAASNSIGSGTNSFTVSAIGGLAWQTTVQVLEVATNQPGLLVDTLAFTVTESATQAVHLRLATQPSTPVTVTTINRGTPADSPQLQVAGGGILVFNSTNWNIPQPVIIQANADADTVDDVAVFTVQASGGLTNTLAFTATESNTNVAPDAVYALRNDLGDAFGTATPQSSEPYVLLKYTNSVGRGAMKVYQVLAEDANHQFLSFQQAGQLLQPPNPLTTLPKCLNTVAISGPYFQDKNYDHWAKAAGISNGLPVATNIILHYFYHPLPTAAANGFDGPAGSGPYSGSECLPWLDQFALTPGTPINYTFNITWPDNIPVLQVGETLIRPKAGLPDVADQCSVDVIYEQTGAGTLVQLYDPLSTRAAQVPHLPGNELPSGIVTQVDPSDQKLVFMQAPITIRKRLKFNPNTTPPQLEFSGYYNDTAYVGDPLLLPNVMTLADANAIKALDSSHNATFSAAIDALQAATVLDVQGVSSEGSQFKALTAAYAAGQGYVALAMQNSSACGALPVSIEILKVACPLYPGDIKVLLPDCPFDETLTLRHSADFAGRGDNYAFQWFYRQVGSTTWIQDPTQTNQDLTITGPGLRTLDDYEYYCHYRPLYPSNLCGSGVSPDTQSQVAEGWIKRVITGINPFTQISDGFHIDAVSTTASMIAQAGPRWEGDIALNCLPGNQYGLIQGYETVLRRGIGLSIGAGIQLTDDTALRLAAGAVSDLYMLLGNEAYADAEDPTIGFGTDSATPGISDQNTASSIFCFQGEAASLLDEELILLRGRDGPFGNDSTPGTRVDVAPVYNRLYWNFGADPQGETAYVLNYNITDQDNSGTIDATDARIMFPQGHGDAWGHYLSAATAYYQLFSNSNYTWVPQFEDVNINGADVQVNYQYERKFAKVAAARANTGAEIVNLTYRSVYTEDPAGQWQGYSDSDTNRAWGVTEWASRAGQAALFDWLAANTLLPANDTNDPPLTKVDRTTVTELPQVAASFLDIQQAMDNADQGLNPLGLDKNVVPFGIDPGALTTGQTHFDQIYARAIGAMNNALAVFNFANEPTQLLRQQEDTLANFQRTVNDQLNDFTNQLIETFGYPYNEDIGGSGAYASGYAGPDLYHFSYVDTVQIDGVVPSPSQTVNLSMVNTVVGPDGTLTLVTNQVPFNLATDSKALVKPSNFTTRLAPGDLQRNLSDLAQANTRLQQAIVSYGNLISQIADQAQLIQSQYNLNAQQITVLNQGAQTQKTLNDLILEQNAAALDAREAAQNFSLVASAEAEFLPLSVGFSSDVTSAMRGAFQLAGAIATDSANNTANDDSQTELAEQQAQQEAQTASNIELTTIQQSGALLSQLAQLQQLVRQEAVSRYDLYTLREAASEAAGTYQATLAKGNAVIGNRLRFLQETAAQVQIYRYKDMAFRIFRNDALQKYRSQFDLAARYVYLAAKAYDYETGLLQTSSQSGSSFLEDIVKKQAIGTIENGVPIAGTTGDSGLAASMAAMGNDYASIKANLGLNNQITRDRLFSLRNGWFRIGNASTNTTLWQQTLQRAIVNNVWDIPEFQRYCRPLRPQPANGDEPAIVINFPSEIIAEDNFFGWPAGGGDSAYNSSVYSTKILSVGIWFSSYDSTSSGLVQYPNAWLVPVGEDVVRAAGGNDFSYRHWKVIDQKIPVPNDFLGSPPNYSLNWIPINFSLNGQFGAVGGDRQYSAIDATTDSQTIPLDTSHIQTDSGLIGRSVWNTQWMLIIPGVGLLGSDADEGLQRFIAGALVGGQRTGDGVTDIKIYFQTYSYSGF